MEAQRAAPLSVLVLSSGNPDGALLAAGLLRGRPGDIGAVIVQGVDAPTPAPEVRRVLGEAGLDPRGWTPQPATATSPGRVDVGLTICVPT